MTSHRPADYERLCEELQEACSDDECRCAHLRMAVEMERERILLAVQRLQGYAAQDPPGTYILDAVIEAINDV